MVAFEILTRIVFEPTNPFEFVAKIVTSSPAAAVADVGVPVIFQYPPKLLIESPFNRFVGVYDTMLGSGPVAGLEVTSNAVYASNRYPFVVPSVALNGTLTYAVNVSVNVGEGLVNRTVG